MEVVSGDGLSGHGGKGWGKQSLLSKEEQCMLPSVIVIRGHEPIVEIIV